MNRYYLFFPDTYTIAGPYKFKGAVEEKTYYDSIGDKTEILKTVVDIFGSEVK